MSIEVTLSRELPIAPIGPTPFPTEGHSSKSSPRHSWNATPVGAALYATHCADRPLLQQKVLDAAQKDLPGLAIAIGYCIHKVLVKDGALQAANLLGGNPRFNWSGTSTIANSSAGGSSAFSRYMPVRELSRS